MPITAKWLGQCSQQLQRRNARALATLVVLMAIGSAAASGQTREESLPGGGGTPFIPNVQPTLHVSRAGGPIKIDGELDDAGWQGAVRAENFAENFPREKARPSVRSEVWVTYDDRNLYLAFIADDDPGTIRTSLRDRDEMWQDDYFGILLDTFGDAAWAYFLFANPLGVQGDSRFATAGGEDDGFDIIYESRGKVTDRGYQIEMAIPFASLRFPDRPIQTWRATFWRTRPRGSREQHTWAAIDRNEQCLLCQFGTLTGIAGVKAGGALELLPSVVASQTGALEDGEDPTSRFRNDVTGDVSLGARYSFAAGLTAEGTFNPDFSQVESDVAQIDVNTTFALFFPERRPFFQEGSDLFGSFFNVVYTRQINNPQFATKLVGRLGRTGVGYLAARDEDSPLLLPFEERSFVGRAGKSITNIARLRQTFLRSSYVGAIFSDRRFESGSGSGTVGGVDGVFRVLGNYRLEYQFLGSHTRELDDPTLTAGVNDVTFDRGKYTAALDGESYTGYAQYTSFERDARFWNFDFDYWASSPTFRTDNGFEFRNDFRRASMWQGLFFYPNTRLIDQVTPNIVVRREWKYDGARKRDLIQPDIWFNLTGQTYLEFWYQTGTERFADVEFAGINRWNVFARTNFIDPIRVGVFLSWGRDIFRDRDNPLLGTGTTAEIFATLKPTTRLVIEPSFNFSELSEPDGGPELFSGYIIRTRTSFQFTRELFLRFVIQYNDFSQHLSVEPLLTYKVNPFTLFFIGSTVAYQDYDQPDRFAQTSRQLFAKFQYLFRK